MTIEYDFNHFKDAMLPEPFDLVPISSHRHHRLKKGDVAFRQDDKTRGLFFVINGNIELRRFTQDGQSVIVYRAKSGDTFAEASLFSQRYHCDAIAVSESHLIELDRKAILAKFQREANFALAIVKRFARQNQQYRRKLELFAIRSAEERITAAVLEGLLTESIKAFATEIGLTHEVVYRGLAKLVNKGVLVKTGRGKYSV